MQHFLYIVFKAQNTDLNSRNDKHFYGLIQ